MRSRRKGPVLPAAHRPRRLQQCWLDRSVRVKGLIVVAVPLIALIVTTSASLALQVSERHERSNGTAASGLINASNQVLADAVNAETGIRGYAATRDPLFLAPYDVTLAQIGADRRTLRSAALATGESRQQRAADATTGTVLAELAVLRSAIGSGVPMRALRPALENGNATMDVLRGQMPPWSASPLRRWSLTAPQSPAVRTRSTYSTSPASRSGCSPGWQASPCSPRASRVG